MRKARHLMGGDLLDIMACFTVCGPAKFDSPRTPFRSAQRNAINASSPPASKSAGDVTSSHERTSLKILSSPARA
jgi:hypothetical protein